MTLFEILGTVLIGPLKMVFELIFSVAQKIIGAPGPAIIVLSLAMNVLALPLYRRADAIQIEARDTENRMKDVVTHIKKTFSGDERMMILQTYYRQNNYSPLSVLSGSVSLMLEIPFFMAAYQFLSKLSCLKGVAWGPIADLSAPDGLLAIGSLTINLLPIIMTLINVISSSLYLKGFPLKTKIQLYGMALFFLVFLYNSPSALVFYWTLNNTFSLVKTLFYGIKNAKKILQVLVGAAGAALIALKYDSVLVVCLGCAMQLLWLLPLLKRKFPGKENSEIPKPNRVMFVLGGVFLTVLVGLLIPSTYISVSVQEYISSSYFYAPIWYIVYSLSLAAGLFLVWFGVFYWLANPKGKVFFTRLVWILSGVMLVNYMFFGTKLGIVSPDLMYTEGFSFGVAEHIINVIAVLALAAGLYFLSVKFPRAIPTVLLVGVIALGSMSVINITKVVQGTEQTRQQLSEAEDPMPTFSLSKEGKNVVVIMLDRGINQFIPYILEEKPELKTTLDGFTYYPNTLSYGSKTNFGAPALYGGYEYTPVNMNLRSNELLEDKHNEALLVVPRLMAENGFAVSVIDPSYAGYSWIPNLSIYDEIEGVKAYHADGRFNDMDSHVQTVTKRTRNFFLFSLMKTLPVSLQKGLYDEGQYLTVPSGTKTDTSGVKPAFMNAYNVVKNLSSMTTVTEDDTNTYMFLRSNITHEAVILQEPSYEPASQVDNSAYYGETGKIITAGDSSYQLDGDHTLSHYHVNMAALIQLGNWFDYLRENGVYDNTRIILASDHGQFMELFDKEKEYVYSTENYQPTLLVKDFDAKGFTVSEEFMTNADVPTLTMEGLIENPVNPYTGKPIDSSYKTENEKQYVIASLEWDIQENNGKQFLPSAWGSVSGDVRDKANWEFYTDLTLLPPTLQE